MPFLLLLSATIVRAVPHTNHRSDPTLVTGTTVSQKGDVLAGVTVTAKDDNTHQEISTATDEQGIFLFRNLPAGNRFTFTFSMVGYETYHVNSFLVQAGRKNTLLIKLKEQGSELNRVVVIGYGSQSKRNVTGAIGILKPQDIQDQPVSNFDQAMAGKLAGVEVLQTSGEPGQPATFRIRGTTSITAGTSPLFVVDGVPLDGQSQPFGTMNPGQSMGAVGANTALEAVDPNDIASIEVLKDASAAAIYGSRGANGVVLITTKHGKAGRMSISYSATGGLAQINKEISMLNAYQYAALDKDGHDNAYLEVNPNGNASDPDSIRPIGYERTPPDLYPYLAGTPGLTNTNWQDKIFRTAPYTNQTLSVSGGKDNLTFFVSGNYTSQNGIIINSGYKRYSTRLNLDAGSGRLHFGLNFSPSYSIENVVQAYGPYSNYGVVGSALQMSPSWPVYNPNGTYNFDGNGKWRIGTDYQNNEVLNPVAIANLINDKVYHTNLLGKVFVEYEFIKDLKYNLSLGGTLNDYNENYYRPSTLPLLGLAYYTSPSNPTATSSSFFLFDWVLEHTLSWKHSVGDHHFTALAGFTAQKSHSNYNSVTATNFPNDLVQSINAGQVISGAAAINEWSLLSALARIQYDYKDRYLLSASFRTDGCSRFGANNKWGDFPSVSAGWRVSEESFMEKVSVISNLKLRASYGLTGNFEIGNYAPIALMNSSNYILGTGSGALTAGEVPISVSNPNLGWETTAMFNGGLDIGFFKDALTLEADWYNSNTYHLLLNVPVPNTTGFNAATENLGKVDNRGLELTLGTQQHLGAVNLRASVHVATNKNTVKALGPGNAPIIATTPASANVYFITEVGKPIGSFYLLKQNGVFLDSTQLKAYPHFANAAPGDFRYLDNDHNGVLDLSADRTIVGKYFPDYTFGFSGYVEWKGIDLAFSIQGSKGGQIINWMRHYIDNMEGNFNNMTDALHRWRSPADPGDGKTPRANRKSTGNNETGSNWEVEDASYARLQNVTLGYSLPFKLLNSVHIHSLRVFLTVQNLVTITKYSGYNPEVNLFNGSSIIPGASSQGALTPGIDYGTYPLSRTYAAGINIGF